MACFTQHPVPRSAGVIHHTQHTLHAWFMPTVAVCPLSDCFSPSRTPKLSLCHTCYNSPLLYTGHLVVISTSGHNATTTSSVRCHVSGVCRTVNMSMRPKISANTTTGKHTHTFHAIPLLTSSTSRVMMLQSCTRIQLTTRKSYQISRVYFSHIHCYEKSRCEYMH